MEYWKTIPGTNGKLLVSSEGRIKSLLRGERILKSGVDSKGYLRLRVTIDRKKYCLKVHRVVAQVFIDNPEQKPQVNHINGNKQDNRVENLEWVTNKENANHAIVNGLWDSVVQGALKSNLAKRKAIIGKFGDMEKVFDSVSEAERFLGSRHVVDVLKGKRSTVKGWSFSYLKGGDACVRANI